MKAPTAPRNFQTTCWTTVRRAGNGDPAARHALATLCESYWYPVYAFIRRAGKSAHDAEDLTQGFFARLLEKGIFANADPAKGKLRSFLLTCVRNFVADEHARDMAAKRGAGLIMSLDLAWAEDNYAHEPVDDLTPDRLFQRRWALTVLEFSLELLREEFVAAGKGALFSELRPFLGFGRDGGERYEAVAAQLGLPMGTVKSHVFRLRKRWRELLIQQVSATLDEPTPENIQGELSELLVCV